MLAVSAPPPSISMNRFQQECFPHTSTSATIDDGSSSNDFAPIRVMDANVQPIVREQHAQLDVGEVAESTTRDHQSIDKPQRPGYVNKPITIIPLTPIQQQEQQQQLSSDVVNVPPAPPLEPTQQLLRPIASEPVLCRSNSLPSLGQRSVSLGSGRRSIFGNYWEKKSHGSGSGISHIPMVRSLATFSTMAEWHSSSVSQLPPPPPCLKPTRYVPLMSETMSQKSHHHHPLQSLTNGERWNPAHKRNARSAASTIVTVPATNGGAYPLCSPRSILRRRAANHTSDPTHTLRFLEQQDDDHDHRYHLRDSSESSTELPFALTKSIKQLQRKQHPEGDNVEEDEPTEESSCCSSISSNKAKSSSKTTRIHFNPIVVVTEFEEDQYSAKRQWFSERELSRFQSDAIGKARAYLHSRPKLAQDYNQLRLCPVTGAMRKKALFSLPALGSIVEDVLPKVFSSDFQKLSERELRNILIVEPNNTVRDLFCRCMHSLYPWAQILGAPSGEEAWLVIERGFMRNMNNIPSGSDILPMDLIIVDEKLSRSRHHASLSPATAVVDKSMEEDGAHHLQEPEAPSPPSMTSYELLRRIRNLEEQVCGKTELPTTTSTSQPPRRPLVIAVTLDLAHHADQLEASGADIVWGIPPPSPCIALRNQLVFALVTKRRFRGDDDSEWGL